MPSQPCKGLDFHRFYFTNLFSSIMTGTNVICAMSQLFNNLKRATRETFRWPGEPPAASLKTDYLFSEKNETYYFYYYNYCWRTRKRRRPLSLFFFFLSCSVSMLSLSETIYHKNWARARASSFEQR